jgi:hypothetical protein
MKLKIKASYKKPSDTFLLKLGGRIKAGMKNNPYLPNPIPTQPEVEKAYVDFEVSLSIAGRNDRTLLSAKNDKKAVLIGLLAKLADYVTITSNGDKTILLSSGFDITGIKGASQDLTPIEQLDVEIGPPGQAIARVKRVPGARVYMFQCTPDPITPDSDWTSETSTDRENTFTNLKSIAKYWFRVIAIGRGKQSVSSVLVSRVIQ